MTIQAFPLTYAKSRKYALMHNRFRKHTKLSILSYYEYSAFGNLSDGSIEERLRLTWTRQKMEKEAYKRILLQSTVLRESLLHSYNPAEAWLQMPEQFIKRTSVSISYDNKDSVYTLLGAEGEIVLNKVIDLIQKEAEEGNWPLTKIEVHYERDAEIEDWKYLVIVLDYDSSFEDANKYLDVLYGCLEGLAERLNPDEKAILAELIYVDIRAGNDIYSG